MIASNSDEQIADLLVEIYEKEDLGMESISIGNATDCYSLKPNLEIIEGYSFDSGFLSPYFTNDDGVKECVSYGTEKSARNDESREL